MCGEVHAGMRGSKHVFRGSYRCVCGACMCAGVHADVCVSAFECVEVHAGVQQYIQMCGVHAGVRGSTCRCGGACSCAMSTYRL